MMTKFETRVKQTQCDDATESVAVNGMDFTDDVQVYRSMLAFPGGRWIRETVTLTREQAAHVAAELTRWLEETAPVDPAYEAYAEKSAAAIPATDDEWKDRLVEGGVA